MKYLRAPLTILALGLAVWCAASTDAFAAQNISIGLRTQTWPFMWVAGRSLSDRHGLSTTEKVRWRMTVAALGRYKELGANWNMLILREGVDGRDGFARAKRAVQEYQKRGIHVVLRIVATRSTYAHLDQTVSAEYGYNKNYYNWIKNIASTFQHSVQFYLIGNEVDHGIGPNLLSWQRAHSGPVDVTYGQYLKVLTTAYKAIKSVSKNLQVVNYGVSGFSLGAAVADRFIRLGEPEKAYSYWKRFRYGKTGVATVRGLVRTLLRPKVRRRIAFVRETFRRPGPCDYVQFHYYGGAAALPQTIAWMRREMKAGGQERPLFAGEVGYLVPNQQSFQRALSNSTRLQQDQASTIVKDFSAIFGSGIDYALYWYSRNWVDVGNVAPLFEVRRTASNFVPFEAASAFKFLAHHLNGLHSARRYLQNISGVTSYRFAGSRNISIAWAHDGSATIDLKRYPAVSSIVALDGSPVSIGANGLLSLTTVPTYIFWENSNN